ncbi:hypothetical protein [Streptomyces sp. NPDC090022]|uniref:hypothetical protein n=1 Tax=Streptomyces sp. NPDC090022 TaxID=3365920 RepID=UPI003823DA0E
MSFRMPARGRNCRSGSGRTAAALAIAAVLPLTATLAGAGAAHAAPVADGDFNWMGDQGDGFDDQARWYGAEYNDTFDATASADHNSVRVVVNRPGDVWTAEFTAPAGQQLAVGSYVNAVKAPELPGATVDAPGMFVNGYYGGCKTLEGSFTVKELEFGEGRTVRKLVLDYRQDCDDRAELRGSLHVTSVAPPKPMQLAVTVNTGAKLTKGTTTLSGTVTCTKPARLHVGGSARQEQPSDVIGNYAVEVDCVPGKRIPWKAPVTVHTPEVGHPLVKGRTTVYAGVQGKDPDTGTYQFGSTNVYVNLKP